MDEMKKKILIVDDEPDLCEMAKRKLERSGYEVNVAGPVWGIGESN